MGGKKVTGPHCLELEEFWGCSTARSFFNKKGLSYLHILIQYGGWGTIEPSWGTPHHSVLSLPNRFLDGAAATQSCLFGGKSLSINARNMGTNIRTQNTSHNSETWGRCSNSRIQLRPSWMFWTRQMLHLSWLIWLRHISSIKANGPWKTAPSLPQDSCQFSLILITLDGIASWKVEFHTLLSFQSNQCSSNTIHKILLRIGVQI